MPRLKAETDNGQEIHVHVPKLVSWALSLASVAIISGTALLINLNLRVTVIENTRFRASDAVELISETVPRREFDLLRDGIEGRLDRIEDKLDEALRREP